MLLRPAENLVNSCADVVRCLVHKGEATNKFEGTAFMSGGLDESL